MDRESKTLWLSVRRIDGHHHVLITDLDDNVEHTHCHPFRERKEAFRLRGRVEKALAAGNDLNLVHWSSEPLA